MTGRQTKHRQSGRQRSDKSSETGSKVYGRTDTNLNQLRSVGNIHIYMPKHSHYLTSKYSHKRVQKFRLVVVILLHGAHCWQNVVFTDQKTEAINAAGGHPCFRRYCSLDSYPKKVISPSIPSLLNFLVDWRRLLPIPHLCLRMRLTL
jgi:hypothetical protein